MIDTVYNRCVDTTPRCRKEHFCNSAFKMCRSLFLAGKKACTFHDQVNAKVSPRQRRRITFRQGFDQISIDQKTVFNTFDGCTKFSMHRIVLQQVCISLLVRQIVDCHNFKFMLFGRFVKCPHNVTTDPTKSVNCYSNRHSLFTFAK